VGPKDSGNGAQARGSLKIASGAQGHRQRRRASRCGWRCNCAEEARGEESPQKGRAGKWGTRSARAGARQEGIYQAAREEDARRILAGQPEVVQAPRQRHLYLQQRRQVRRHHGRGQAAHPTPRATIAQPSSGGPTAQNTWAST
jgi:hypothetical protein